MCDVQWIALATGVLVCVSEVLPFLKKFKSNGIVHALVCLLNSECIREIADIDSDSDAVTSEEFNAVTIEMKEGTLSDSSSGEFSDY
jgi:hypothetical protein